MKFNFLNDESVLSDRNWDQKKSLNPRKLLHRLSDVIEKVTLKSFDMSNSFDMNFYTLISFFEVSSSNTTKNTRADNE
jgi:hypothetical protein